MGAFRQEKVEVEALLILQPCYVNKTLNIDQFNVQSRSTQRDSDGGLVRCEVTFVAVNGLSLVFHFEPSLSRSGAIDCANEGPQIGTDHIILI